MIDSSLSNYFGFWLLALSSSSFFFHSESFLCLVSADWRGNSKELLVRNGLPPPRWRLLRIHCAMEWRYHLEDYLRVWLKLIKNLHPTKIWAHFLIHVKPRNSSTLVFFLSFIKICKIIYNFLKKVIKLLFSSVHIFQSNTFLTIHDTNDCVKNVFSVSDCSRTITSGSRTAKTCTNLRKLGSVLVFSWSCLSTYGPNIPSSLGVGGLEISVPIAINFQLLSSDTWSLESLHV